MAPLGGVRHAPFLRPNASGWPEAKTRRTSRRKGEPAADPRILPFLDGSYRDHPMVHLHWTILGISLRYSELYRRRLPASVP